MITARTGSGSFDLYAVPMAGWLALNPMRPRTWSAQLMHSPGHAPVPGHRRPEAVCTIGRVPRRHSSPTRGRQAVRHSTRSPYRDGAAPGPHATAPRIHRAPRVTCSRAVVDDFFRRGIMRVAGCACSRCLALLDRQDSPYGVAPSPARRRELGGPRAGRRPCCSPTGSTAASIGARLGDRRRAPCTGTCRAPDPRARRPRPGVRRARRLRYAVAAGQLRRRAGP